MNIYNRYAPFIRDFIYQNNWESLRAVQVAAGDIIFNTDHNLLLSASTASGKTEAAFFPILTLFYEDPPKSVGALYIGPLKALINDQFMRLNDLCREADIPVWHWHGDVAQSHKEKLQKTPPASSRSLRNPWRPCLCADTLIFQSSSPICALSL
jgi:ATP-dependent Lhr-like helicase